MSSAPTATSASAPAAPSRGASPKPGSAASALASPASAASAPSPVSNAPAPRTLTVPPLPPLTEAESADVTRRALALRAAFAQDVARRLNVPDAEQRAYGERLQQTLDANGLGELAREYVVLVDRAPNVQAVFLYFRTTHSNAWQMIGASPVATGLPGQYDHFVTPLGVFEHTPENMDFRAEGTTNDNGIRGYGQRDMRIYDFGWTDAERGWGKGGVSQMRFQMHATDPEYLEPLLGIRHSKGCVRIPASLNVSSISTESSTPNTKRARQAAIRRGYCARTGKSRRGRAAISSSSIRSARRAPHGRPRRARRHRRSCRRAATRRIERACFDGRECRRCG